MIPELQAATSLGDWTEVAESNDRGYVTRPPVTSFGGTSVRALVSSRAGVRLALLLAIASCHGDTTGPRDITVTLAACGLASAPATKTCPATSLLPLQFVEVTAGAKPPGPFSNDRIVIPAQGVINPATPFVAQLPSVGVAFPFITHLHPPFFGHI